MCIPKNEADKVYILDTFSSVFDCNTLALDEKSRNIGFYWDDLTVFMSDIEYRKDSSSDLPELPHFQQKHSILLESQMKLLKNVTECVLLEKPLIVCTLRTPLST